MRKIISLFATLIVALTANAQFAGGKGTAEDPYQIADAYQLADMQNYRSSYFKLINDVDLTEWIEDNSPTLGWSPIGSKDAPFTGDFNGNGFTISGLMINRPTQDFVGLFGFFSSSKSIKNVNIQSPTVVGKSYTSVFCGYASTNGSSFLNLHALGGGKLKGQDYTGTICGRSEGATIQSCKSELNEFVCESSYGGGICGRSIKDIEKCTVKIDILKSTFIGNAYIGGIVGYATNTNLSDNFVLLNNIDIYHSSSSAAYIGGIVGELYNDQHPQLQINNNISFILSSSIGNTNRGIAIGGICCMVNSYSSSNNYWTKFSNCYTYCDISSVDQLSGILAYSSGNVNLKNCLTDGIVESQSNIVSGICSSSSTYATIDRCLVICPKLKSTGSTYGVSATKTTNSVCVSDFIDGASSRYRISGNSSSSNNKALISTKLLKDGVEIEVEDDAYNGTAYGEKTLKRASAYTGLGWDMNKDWKIIEGESYPYLRILSDYPTITKYETTSNCRLTGTCPVNGKIYVMKNGATYTSDIVDNAFDINVGAVNVGDTLLYFSMPEGGKPSMVRKLILTEGTIDPSGDVIKGDANGDSVVDAADVVSTVNSILGKPSSTFVKKNADINEDGQILVDDAVGTVNIIMNAQ